jgi:HD-GYP domain-containing protein (c-di-GMP phosphodiesterase class II)
MDKLFKAIAQALDIVEGEFLGASTHHGRRIATLSAAMGRYFGLDVDNLRALVVCALLHDNALTEYVLSERTGGVHDPAMKLHCEYGQKNVEAFKLAADISGYILYHHERANGMGPYRKKAGEYPLGAEIIGIADTVDVTHHLQRVAPSELPNIRKNITDNIGIKYTERVAEAMLTVLDEEMLFSLRDEAILNTAEKVSPWVVDIEDTVIYKLGAFITRIIDYKSTFTRKHCIGIAQKAWHLGGVYGYDGSVRAQFYLAASLHDIGKLATPVRILEKPGPLTGDEFAVIKNHVYLTYTLLKDIDGFEHICNWASNHHEKLDGSGYHFGKKADELDFNSRLLACIDIYQALTEERPYHAGRDHKTAIEMLSDMGRRGFLDTRIIKDLDDAYHELWCRLSPGLVQ